MVTHNRVTPAARQLKYPATRLRSLGVKVAVAPLSLRWRQRKPIPARKLWRLTTTPLYQSLTAKTPRRSGKQVIVVLLTAWMQTSAHGRTKRTARALKQWDKRDKMTCDHVEPGKGVRCPNLLGMPLDYMESHEVFKSLKTSEYDLCHFYKVELSGDFPEFPTHCEPVTNDHMHGFLEKAWEFSQPNLLVAHSQDTVFCLLCKLHNNASLRCLKMGTDTEAGGKIKRKLSFCPFCQYSGSNDPSYLNHIICMHYNASYGCRKCLKEVFPTGQQLTVHIKCCKGLKMEVTEDKLATSPAKGASSSSSSSKKKKHQTKSQQSD